MKVELVFYRKGEKKKETLRLDNLCVAIDLTTSLNKNGYDVLVSWSDSFLFRGDNIE